MLQYTARRIEHRDMTLVGRRIADVAGGRRNHVTTEDAERRGDLLPLGQARDGRAPNDAAIRYGELLDMTVR